MLDTQVTQATLSKASIHNLMYLQTLYTQLIQTPYIVDDTELKATLKLINTELLTRTQQSNRLV